MAAVGRYRVLSARAASARIGDVVTELPVDYKLTTSGSASAAPSVGSVLPDARWDCRKNWISELEVVLERSTT